MPATQTLPTISHDQVAVIPPIVTLVTIIEDPRSHMDRLERRIGQMRDPDGMISWDDPDDVLVATLPVGFRMPDIERYTDEAQLLTLFPLSLSGTTQRWYASLEISCRRTWEDLAQEFLRQYSFSGDTSVTRRELESLRQGSDEFVSSFISRWRERAAEMIERPTERDQISMFLRSLHPRGKGLVDHLRVMEVYVLWTFNIDGLVIILMRDHCRYPGVISRLYSIIILIQFSSTLLCILILSQCDLHFSFSVHRLASHGNEQSRPHRQHQRTYSDLGMPLDRAFERLRATGFLVPLAPRPPPSTFPPRFRAHEFYAYHQMAGHRTDYCASLRHTIHDLIDSGAVSFPISTTDTDLGPDMTVDSFPAYSTHAVPPPSGLYHHVWTPRALIFTGHFDTLLVYFGTTLLVGRLEYIEIRLLQLRFTMSDEIAPITLTTLYEMMVDLTRRVERIELILSEHPSSSRGAPGVAMPSLPHLTPSMFATLGASHPRPRPHSAMGFLAPLAPRALPDPMPPQFRLDLYCTYHQSVGHHTDRCTALRHVVQDIIDSGTFGHPQYDMFPIPTSAQAMHADSPSPAVLDLIDLGD
ncbi:hypothetical protein CK203_070954 [Vitis vinifera]|uniref:Retrotransposon gag domain-containing protein n=1 Tax=Vitis vinifera TaxID=29760 RepID=A0A438E9B2_VITVI|nr:hypothetical protein CK203_070954 [Vitis vinifera]